MTSSRDSIEPPTKPVVLMIGGHDPSGGAGLQADIETAVHFGCHPVTVAAALTVQDTRSVRRFECVSGGLIREQLELLAADQAIVACKTGMLASPHTVELVAQFLSGLSLPLVVDPVCVGGGGGALAERDYLDALIRYLLPLAILVTPNLPECRLLTGDSDPDAAANRLLQTGCRNVLLTGTHDTTADIVHRYYRPGESCLVSRYARLPREFHGSGCTLASAVAALIARGQSVHRAVQEALDYTWRTLEQGYPSGRGQWLPNRLVPRH